MEWVILLFAFIRLNKWALILPQKNIFSKKDVGNLIFKEINFFQRNVLYLIIHSAFYSCLFCSVISKDINKCADSNSQSTKYNDISLSPLVYQLNIIQLNWIHLCRSEAASNLTSALKKNLF